MFGNGITAAAHDDVVVVVVAVVVATTVCKNTLYKYANKTCFAFARDNAGVNSDMPRDHNAHSQKHSPHSAEGMERASAPKHYERTCYTLVLQEVVRPKREISFDDVALVEEFGCLQLRLRQIANGTRKQDKQHDATRRS